MLLIVELKYFKDAKQLMEHLEYVTSLSKGLKSATKNNDVTEKFNVFIEEVRVPLINYLVML